MVEEKLNLQENKQEPLQDHPISLHLPFSLSANINAQQMITKQFTENID